jgi:carbohydrate-selective porin OprB
MVHELHSKNWSFRYGGAGMPKTANGGRFDRRLLRDRGDVLEVERRFSSGIFGDRPGAIRALQYFNHADAGTYADSLQLAAHTKSTPDITATRRIGTLKYGTGVNFEQEIARDIGVFARLGWNDGKTESFAFTSIDRLAGAGVSVKGTRWHRKSDVAGTSFTASGISGVHATYLAQGGLDFLIGDGKLTYAPEYVWESYYNARVAPGFFAGFDLQHVANPAFNQDRGPVWVASARLHIEFGVRPLQAK